MSNLQEEIGSLSAAEKLELIDALWESLEAAPRLLTNEQQRELDDRMASYEKNPSSVLPWEQVRADLLVVIACSPASDTRCTG